METNETFEEIKKIDREIHRVGYVIFFVVVILVLGIIGLPLLHNEYPGGFSGDYANMPYYISSDISANIANPTLGSMAINADTGWITAINDVRDEDNRYALFAGEKCFLLPGGFITVVEIQSNDMLVVEYEPNTTGGTLCPAGVHFQIATASFVTQTSRFMVLYEAMLAELSLVAKMKYNWDGGIELAKSGWITSVNPNLVGLYHAYVGYGGQCMLRGGVLLSRGSVDGKTLYEYYSVHNAKGTDCPSGVLFWEPS